MHQVICLHCSGSSARQWAPYAAALGSGYRVHAPALIGYDDSDAPVDLRSVTLEDEARRIETLIAAGEAPVHLVGHSFGGAVALRVALRRPELVRSLAVYEPVLFALIANGRRNGAATQILKAGHAICDAVDAGRIELSARRFIDYWSGEGAWERLDARRQQGVQLRMPKVAQEFRALFHDPVPLEAYRWLGMPVLLMEGAQTLAPPREILRRLLPQIRHARYLRLAGAGHMGPITHAQEVGAQVADFLAGVDAPVEPRLAHRTTALALA